MSQDALDGPARVVPVMPKSSPGVTLSLNHAACSRIGGYDFISPTVARLGVFRLAVPFGFVHGVHGLLRRDAAVMTRVVSLSILEVA